VVRLRWRTCGERPFRNHQIARSEDMPHKDCRRTFSSRFLSDGKREQWPAQRTRYYGSDEQMFGAEKQIPHGARSDQRGYQMVALQPPSVYFRTRSVEKAMIALFGNGSGTRPQFNITLLGVLTAVIIGLAIDQAHADPQTRFYDAQGRSVGIAAPYGNGGVRYYDARGRNLGTSTTTGNATRFYDASGRPTGSATRPGSLAFPRR
jgi:YD repeat-containing protein